MSRPDEHDPDISYAVACLRTGDVLDWLGREPVPALEHWPSSVPELLRAHQNVDLAPVFARLGCEEPIDAFQETVLLSNRKAHVVQRLRRMPERAVLAVSDDPKKLALMLLGVRMHAQLLERTP